MKKLIFIITGLISLCFAVIVVGVLFLTNLDLNNHKDWLSEQFYKQTGLELVINGNIESSIYPWLGIDVEGISIANLDGFSDESFLVADKAAFRIKLMPMLNQRYEMDTIELNGATVNLEVNATGTNNWSGIAGSGSQGLEEETDQSESFSFNQIIVGGVAIDSVQVNYLDQLNNQTISANNITANIPELVYGEPLDLVMSFQLSATNPELESDINLSSTLSYDLDNNIYALENLNLNFLGSLLEADLRSNDGDINGSINFSTDRTEELFSLAGQDQLSERINDIQLMVFLDGNTDNIQLFPLDLNLGLSGSPFLTTTNLHLYTNAEIDIEDENLMLEDFSVSILDILMTGKFNISKFMSDADINGELDIERFNPKTLSTALDFELLLTRDPDVLDRISFSTNLTVNAESVELNRFIFEVDDTLLTGSLSTVDFNQPDINFDVAINTIDIDRYLAPEQAITPTTNNQTTDDTSFASIQSLNLDGDVSIDELTVSGLTLSDVILGMNADQGLIELEPIQANLYQGSYRGAVNLNVNNAQPQFSMQSTLQSINIEPLSNDFIGASYASGNGNITVALVGSGSNAQSILNSLNGNAELALTDGILEGVDVGAVLAQLETMIRSRQLLSVDRGEQTAFDNLSATVQIENGIARSNDLLLLSPGFNVTGTGTLANLQNQSLDFDLLASVNSASATVESEEYDIGGYSLPINCSGLMNSPSCLPDINSIVSAAIGNVLQEGIVNILGGGGVGGLLDRVLGTGSTTETTSPSIENAESSEEESNPEAADPIETLLNNALDSLIR
ncbi:MAG: AsmA family protein [Gammaproteobacteria bacterium]|jgi:AsmA protein|nr:AsmA family protein [Gammaproteobacteria bacterium]